MQVLQAGDHRLILLELDLDAVADLARQVGFEVEMNEDGRQVTLDLSAIDRPAPLLLFDAADPANLGWFSRCHFYVDGVTGNILQTPLRLANQRDGAGRLISTAVRVQITKELPETFRMPGKQPVTEQMVYAVLFNFLNALVNVGVGVCGAGGIRPLAGRADNIGPRN